MLDEKGKKSVAVSVNCDCLLVSSSSMDLFETFAFGGALRRLAGIASSFGKKPISISGVVADNDARRGDMEYCYAATND